MALDICVKLLGASSVVSEREELRYPLFTACVGFSSEAIFCISTIKLACANYECQSPPSTDGKCGQ